MTMYVHGQRMSTVRRRRRTASAVVLAVLLYGTGWHLWGPDAAVAQGTQTRLPITVVPSAVAPSQDVARALDTAPSTDIAQSRGVAQPPAADDGLDSELARRLAVAQEAAAAAGVKLTLTSGSRSPAEQQELVDQALTHYGSAAEAHRWVLPPKTSEHVTGLAIDVGPTAGALWLGEHAREFGLCRTYANEMWHFEKLAQGAEECPEPHPDALWGW
ncbi:MAG: D-alanyl-D-alanine carboxypeptidase family protein [Cellulomonas sp.]